MPVIVLMMASFLQAGLRSSITYPAPSGSAFDITFTFNQQYTCGQFANGDWWVLGPVTITAISPAYTTGRNGWQVNPNEWSGQGYDDRSNGFNATLIPALPYSAAVNTSVIKAASITGTNTKTSLQFAAVLTVVAAIPPDSGSTVFRPPYCGSSKPYYSTTGLRLDLLPAVNPATGAPGLAWVEDRFKNLQLDHKAGWSGDQIHPIDNFQRTDPYGSAIGNDAGNAVLQLCCAGTAQDKRQAVIYYVQNGIDIYHTLGLGWTNKADGGHGNGRKLPLTFAAVLLDNQAMQDSVKNTATQAQETGGIFGEDGFLYRGFNGTVLWGKKDPWWSEQAYWHDFFIESSKVYRDPYGYIDGGCYGPGNTYDFCCNSFMWRATALALRLMPSLDAVWNNTMFSEYVYRWVNTGAWAQPDPCAPRDSNWSNYGITYGPDGHGDCIRDTDTSDGIGRFPQLQGNNKANGYYSSSFTTYMWVMYRNYTAVEDRPGRLSICPLAMLSVRGNPLVAGAGAVVIQSQVSLAGGVVYSDRGTRVRSLSAQGAKLIWDATADQGQQVKPGVYFVRLQAGTENLTVKVLVIR
jgi:hypothetical protein